MEGLFWLIFLLPLLLFLQRQLHKEIQTIFYVLTKRLDVAFALFSVLFFPGVLLHELSHYLAARLLKVPVMEFSLTPQTLPDGNIRLGYIETHSTDVLRDALIGLAPLLAGSLVIIYIGVVQLNILALIPLINSFTGFKNAVQILLNQPDFWLWLYILLVISSTMFPSSSDRKSWLPIGIFLFIIGLMILVTGIGSWIMNNYGSYFMDIVYVLVFILGLSSAVHAVFLLPLWAMHKVMFISKI